MIVVRVVSKTSHVAMRVHAKPTIEVNWKFLCANVSEHGESAIRHVLLLTYAQLLYPPKLRHLFPVCVCALPFPLHGALLHLRGVCVFGMPHRFRGLDLLLDSPIARGRR